MRRLYQGSMERTDYSGTLTSLLLPTELCASGFTESEAIAFYGSAGETIDVQVALVRATDACFGLNAVGDEHTDDINDARATSTGYLKAIFLKSEKVCAKSRASCSNRDNDQRYCL